MELRLFSEKERGEGKFQIKHIVPLAAIPYTKDSTTVFDEMVNGLAKHLTRTYIIKDLFKFVEIESSLRFDEVSFENFYTIKNYMNLYYIQEVDSKLYLDSDLQEAVRVLLEHKIELSVQVNFEYYLNAILGHIEDPLFNVEGCQGIVEWLEANPSKEIQYCNAIEEAFGSPNSSVDNPYALRVDYGGMDFTTMTQYVNRTVGRKLRVPPEKIADSIRKGEVDLKPYNDTNAFRKMMNELIDNMYKNKG